MGLHESERLQPYLWGPQKVISHLLVVVLQLQNLQCFHHPACGQQGTPREFLLHLVADQKPTSLEHGIGAAATLQQGQSRGLEGRGRVAIEESLQHFSQQISGLLKILRQHSSCGAIRDQIWAWWSCDQGVFSNLSIETFIVSKHPVSRQAMSLAGTVSWRILALRFIVAWQNCWSRSPRKSNPRSLRVSESLL